TILTELEFGEDEQSALLDLAERLTEKIDVIAGVLSIRGRQVALESEGLRRFDILKGSPVVRPSIRRVRRHACLQWLRATLSGNYDSQFSHQVRNIWVPILVAERDFDRPVPAVVSAFLDYVEGFLTSWIIDRPQENFVPDYRAVYALRVALEVQRHLLGVPQ
ncbi:MAG: hypothetical protein ACE5F1_15480, partial [Planctomycetota bacterium]